MDNNLMNTGLTIAFICTPKNDPTIINYNKFGNKYWDDTLNNNKSKIGYYFAYYFRKKYVYIHKIINIVQPCDRPHDMDWVSNRQILCLSGELTQFTWNEWITGIGLGAPYTPTYHCTRTSSWSYHDLHLHKKYKTFNFINFRNIIEPSPVKTNTNINIPLHEISQTYEEIIDYDSVLLDNEHTLVTDVIIPEITRIEDTDNDLVILKLLTQKANNLLTLLRKLKCDELREQLLYFKNIVNDAEKNIDQINIEIDTIMNGNPDNDM